MSWNKRTPLPGTAEDAYNSLITHLDDLGQGISRGEFHDLLIDQGFDPGDAEYALTKLLERGYLYEVDSELFITEPGYEE